MILLVFLVPFLVLLDKVLVFILTLFNTHVGYIHLVSACLRFFLHVATIQGWRRQFLLYDAVNLLHYTLMKLYGYCPIEGTCQYVSAFCILWSSDFLLHLVL